MKILVSWSSGKDSAWMLHVLRRDGVGTPAGLLTTLNGAVDRVAMHAVRREVLEAQASAAELPLWTVPLPYPCSNEVYERLMTGVMARAAGEGFTHVAFGDLFLEDVRSYREQRLQGTGLSPMFPLWKRGTRELAIEMIDGGLEATVTCVDPRVLDRTFAGRAFDRHLLELLPPGVDPCGERGEFHTCVSAGPMFSRALRTTIGETVERDGFVFCDLILSR
jgi:uncharacterized protein (TIGR00290 family)